MEQTQKMGPPQQSTLFNRKLKNLSSKINIYIEAGSELKAISLESEGMTISAIILEAIEKLNDKYKY